MVARLQSLHQRGGYRQAGGEDQRLGAALDLGQAGFQRGAVGVALARVAEAERILAVGAALEGGGEVDGQSDGAGGTGRCGGRRGRRGFRSSSLPV